jgi:urease accessory protein
MHTPTRRLITAGLCLVALPALAHHTGSPEDIDEFALRALGTGLLHPLSGLDHILTSLGLGLLCLNGRCEPRGVIPASFSAFLVLGALLAGFGQILPMRETLLALSVGALGLAAAFPRAGGWRLAAVLIAGLWTGNAHAAEMPSGLSALAYGVGFLLSQAGLAALTAVLGDLGKSARAEPKRRWAGGLVAASGLVLWLGR